MPKAVKVGAHSYTILRKTKTQMPNDIGSCDTDGLQILIRKPVRSSIAKETLLHELLHACNYPTFVGKENVSEEDIVNATAPVLLQVLRDNPELIEYLRS